MNKKLKNAIIMAAMVLFVPALATAQVTIGSTEVPRATLDVRAAVNNDGHLINPNRPQGIIPPQISVQQLAANSINYATANLPAGVSGRDLNGAIVFVNAIPTGWSNTSAGFHNIVRYVTEPGHYFFDYGDGTDNGANARAWRRLGGGEAAAGAAPIYLSRILRANGLSNRYTIKPAHHTVLYIDGINVHAELPSNLTGAIDGSRITIISSRWNNRVLSWTFEGDVPTAVCESNIHYEQYHFLHWVHTFTVGHQERREMVFVAGLGEVGKWIVVSIQ